MELIVQNARPLNEVSQEELAKEGQDVFQANLKRSPEEIAAGFFMQYYPVFKNALGNLNRKDALRLADALVAWPIEMQTVKFANSNGNNAFRLGIQLIDCKMIMRNVVEMENIQNAINEVQENNAVTDKGENENG